MIVSLTLWDWVKLAGSFILFMGSGLLFLCLFPNSKKMSISMRLILVFGLSLGLWVILLIWLDCFNIALNKWLVRIIFVLIASLLFVKGIKNRKAFLTFFKENNARSDLLIIAFSVLITLLYFYFYRDLIAGMGSDSMHHTLISSLILKNGQLPSDYGPYAPVVSFSYHFGYHSFIAAISWLSGISARLLVVISTAVLMGLASLAGGALVLYLTNNALLGLLSEAIIGIIYVFPAYSLLWGRYTQLMGTLMLMIFIMGLIYWKEQEKFSFKFASVLVVLTIGLLFSHYRIAFVGAVFAVLYLLLQEKPLSNIKTHIGKWAAVPLGAIMLSAPWIIQLLINRKKGFETIGVQTNDSFFSLADRLGPFFKIEIQTWLLIGISVVFILLGFYRRNKIILVVFYWLLALFFISQPMVFGHTVDPVTLIISLYVPIIILTGSGLSIIAGLITKRSGKFIMKIAIVLLVMAGIILGIRRWETIDFPTKTFVTVDDLEAAEWIKNNTEPDALFLINTYQFPINEHLMIGLDAGYWLPVLAERQTVAPPMVYLVEKMSYYHAENDPIKYHLINNAISSPGSAEALRESGVDYIYLGAKGGIIKLESVKTSDDFEHIFQLNDVNIFRVLP